MRSIKLILLSSFATLALESCSVQFPDVQLCSVAGRLRAGADCAFTGHDQISEKDMAQFIEWLEAGALCMSSEDYMKQKTAIEQACVKLGNGCTFEMKKMIADVNKRVSTLQVKARQ